MEFRGTWAVYECELVELDTGFSKGHDVPKAIRVLRNGRIREAAELPRGFVTYPLLDYDFSSDEEVLKFVNEYGIVMCPYAGAVDRTFAAIEEPVIYRRMLHRIAAETKRDEPERTGFFGGFLLRLFRPAVSERPRLIDPSEAFGGCDAEWDSKELFYRGLRASTESDYIRANRMGFMGYFDEDGRLVGTERIRALAMNEAASEHAKTGEWKYPDCLISLEEVRGTLYLLQVAAVVLQGFSYLDGSTDEKRNAGIQRNRYAKKFIPKGPQDEETRRRAIDFADSTAKALVATRRTERMFAIFFAGRPNLLKALYSACNWAICSWDYPDSRPGVPDGILSESERQVVVERLAAAKVKYEDDPKTLELLDKRPMQAGWGHLEENLGIFMQACLNNGWGTEGHKLVSEESFKFGEFKDGGPTFAPGDNRMTLQRAIAEQLASYLEEEASSWQICEECGEPYIYHNTSPKLVTPDEVRKREAEGRKTRKRLPSTTTCSDTHRMRLSRKR